jgi:hypothetical protein
MPSKGLLEWWPVVIGGISLALLIPEFFKHSADSRVRLSALALIAILTATILSATVRLLRVESSVIHYTVDGLVLGATVFAVVQMKRAWTSE